MDIMHSVLVIRPDYYDENLDVDQYNYMIIRSFDNGRTWHNLCLMAYSNREEAYAFASSLNYSHSYGEIDEDDYPERQEDLSYSFDLADYDDAYEEYSELGPLAGREEE